MNTSHTVHYEPVARCVEIAPISQLQCRLEKGHEGPCEASERGGTSFWSPAPREARREDE